MALVCGPDLGRDSILASGRPGRQHAAPQSTSRLEEMFEVPIHGSCPRCHHLHTNKAVRLPFDPQKHTRVTCDVCEHPIVGVGRTSTQTTLASIETIETGVQSQSTGPASASASNQQPRNISTVSAPLRVNTSLDSDQLSTIVEGNSPGQQSSAALLSPNPDGFVSERTPSPNQIDSNNRTREEQGRDRTQHGNTQLRTVTPEHGSPRFSGPLSASRMRRSLRDKISTHFRKTRDFTISRLGIRIQVSTTAENISAHSPPGIDVSLTNQQPRVPRSAVGTAHSTNTLSRGSSISGDHFDPTAAAASIQARGQARPDRLMGREPTQQDKNERIRVRRREATRKRKAEMMARCECRSECHCRSGSDHSNAASSSPAQSGMTLPVPGHPLQHLLNSESSSSSSQSADSMRRALRLAGLGGHAVSDEETMAVESRRSFDDRLSQASTAYFRSNESSISLMSRRPSHLIRSNTAPGLSMRRSGHGYRQGILEALQNSDIPDQIHDTAPEASSSLGTGDSEVGETAAIAAIGSGEASHGSNR